MNHNILVAYSLFKICTGTLYGKDSEKCYCPLMRMTNVVIDQAGNVWAVNNWKPNFDTDASPKTGNPGGDGIVIFVGLAKHPGRI